jgi:type I restriction enzyme, S subunit
MELKPGYKQTEVGVIPEEWEVKPLGIVADVVMGQSPVGSSYNKRGIGTALINGPTEFTDKHPIRIQWTSEPTKFCKKGDLLLCVRGSSTGRMNISNDDYCTGRGVAAIRAKSEADTSFITFQLDSVVREILALTAGSTFPNIDGKSIRAIEIRLSPLPEQRAIAAALSDVDALIGALDQLIAKKRDLKQAAMQQLLTGKHRLPGFHGEWSTSRIGELGEVVTGGTPRTDVKAFWSGDFPWVTPTDISSHRDMFTSERSLTLEGLKSIRELPANTVLVTCIASIGKNAILKVPGGCNQQINAVVPSKNNSAEFLYYLFEASKQYLLANSGTTATSIISKAAFADLVFAIPPLAEQTAIAAVLSDMDAEINTLEARRDKTRALKQGMMQELLTGRIRLV